ncbi:MAG: hypothetical protein KAY37_12740 [Phycisphaerae bacterium]|nr:hypothetical protein [Phycisphaerae bacterium]
MSRLSAILLAAAIVAAACAGENTDDQQLIIEAAAQRSTTQSGQQADPPQNTAEPEAEDLSQAERAARTEANMALAKLELIMGRKALRDGKFVEAARRASRTRVLLRQLPPNVDVSEYELQAEGILTRAAQAGVNVEMVARDAAEEAPLLEGDDDLDRRVQAGVKIAGQYSGSSRPDIDTSGDARALRERTLRRQTPGRYGYRPGREIIDVRPIVDRDMQRLAYQDALRAAYKEDEVRMLVAADEARIVPEREMTYPNDWPERMRRRQKYAGGQIARSASWYDKDGREWYVAVYDIHDLIFVPPDLTLSGTFGVYDTFRDALDRDALRHHSFIFRGGAYDLAAGIPLLRYFGGINPWVAREGTFDLERQREIVEMIKAFTGARVIDEPELPPAPEPTE